MVVIYCLLTLGACARGLQYFVCLFVCYQSPGFFSRLYDKLDIPACSSLVFLGFQLTDFDKTVSLIHFGAFHGYFVVSSPYERFCILLMAVTVTWSDTPASAVLFLPTQQVRSIVDCEWRCMPLQLASDLGSGRQATGRLTAIPIAGCVIDLDRAVSSKKP